MCPPSCAASAELFRSVAWSARFLPEVTGPPGDGQFLSAPVDSPLPEEGDVDKDILTSMAKVQPVIEIHVKAVVPTSGGCAVFLGNDRKVFVIYIDHGVGLAISMAMRQETRERPQTHELIGSVLAGLGAKVERVVINHFADGVYYARLILLAENELYERKIVEIDARPSDSLALAVQAGAPIYLTREVWDGVEDVTELFKKMEKEGFSGGNLEPDS